MQERQFLGIMAVCVLACSATAPATVYNLTPSDNWYGVISGSGLQPGDEVILQSGVYTTGSWLPIEHQGTAANPIIIRAADGANPIITKTTSAQNNMDIRGARHLIIRGLEITGASTAIRIQENGLGEDAKFVTIEDCHIHHTGANAITCNHGYQTYEGMIFRGNEINNTGGHGEAFYLGSNNDALGNTVSVFYNGLIEGNYIHDLVGGTISQGDGIEIKDGSYGNIVRDNIIFNTNYPGIIVYGTDGNPPNIIERNVIIGTNDNGIQAASEAIIRNNIIMDAGGSGIGSHHHQSAIPGNLEIMHNTIITPGHDTVHIYLAEPASGPITVANNALYNGGSGGLYLPGGTVVAGNAVSTNLSADFGNVANYDFFPVPGSVVIGAGNVAYVVVDDFNGTPRGGVADAGAYLYDPNGNPGWEIAPGFKVIPIPAGDANVDGCADGLDYIIWSNNYDQTGTTWKQANFNDDGITDGLDYIIWSNNYMMGCPPSSPGAVPEPTGLLLLAVGGLASLRRGRRR